MGSTTINKKRKHRDAEEATAATKKTKKSKAPPPPVEVEEDEEDDESVPDDDDEEVDGEDGAEEEDEDDDEAGSDIEIEDETLPIDGLPKESAPLLPPTTDSDLFEDMNLSEKTMKSIQEMGFKKMTSIQKSVRLVQAAPNSGSLVY